MIMRRLLTPDRAFLALIALLLALWAVYPPGKAATNGLAQGQTERL